MKEATEVLGMMENDVCGRSSLDRVGWKFLVGRGQLSEDSKSGKKLPRGQRTLQVEGPAGVWRRKSLGPWGPGSCWGGDGEAGRGRPGRLLGPG